MSVNIIVYILMAIILMLNKKNSCQNVFQINMLQYILQKAIGCNATLLKTLNKIRRTIMVRLVFSKEIYLIVKDLSRFGRDYLETGNYIETILPFLGVRFISVNDHFDTVEDCNGNKGLGISLMNLVNDMYAKDVSKRITTAFENCMERGSVLGSAPYGYDRIKNNNGYQLVIDEPAAEIVRRIFVMRISGAKIAEIVRTLNGEEIDTPAKYLERKGLYGTFYTKGEPLWTDYRVRSILNNEMYTGTFVYGKYRVKAVGSKQKKLLPPSEWNRIPNHHEAIVTMEEYEQVQSMKGTVPALFTPAGRRASVYTGRVVCDCCGRNMVYKKDRLGKTFFMCDVNYRKKNNCAHRILITDPEGIIKGELSKHISGLAKLKILLDKEKEQQNERVRGAKQRLNMAEDTLRRLELELCTAYESYVKGLTDKETYLMQKESYEVMLSGIKEKIESRTDNNIALFVSLNKPHSRLTESGVELRLREMGKKLGVEKVHPHKFRRTMATRAIEKGMPIEQVQKILGHEQIDTKLRYAMVNQNNVKLSHRKYIS